MTEQLDGDDWVDPADDLPTEQVRTGVADVDDVLAAVEQLEERPLEEHVGVFETAHERLRRALDGSSTRDDA